MIFFKLLYKKESFIFKQRFEIMRLNSLVSKLDHKLTDLQKELEYYKSENFRKDDLLKGK